MDMEIGEEKQSLKRTRKKYGQMKKITTYNQAEGLGWTKTCLDQKFCLFIIIRRIDKQQDVICS
jgi:hypothetical protein